MSFEPADIIVMILTVTIAIAISAVVVDLVVKPADMSQESRAGIREAFLALVAIISLYVGARLHKKT